MARASHRGATRRALAALGVALALTLVAGGCGAGDPLGALLDHQEAIVDLLEARADDPKAAAAAAGRYLEAHGVELEALRAAAAEALDDPRATAERAMEHAEQLVAVGRRTLELRKNAALVAEPAVREALDAVTGP